MASRKTLVKFRETDEEEYDVEPTKTVKKRKSQPSKKPKKGTSKVQKLLLMVSSGFLSLSLAGCALFPENDATKIGIEEITAVPLENGDIEVTITYNSETMDPVKFLIPAGKEGKNGNGIKSFTPNYDEVTGITTITIEFTDPDVDSLDWQVPAGRGVERFASEIDEDGNTILRAIYTDGTKSDPIKIFKGDSGRGIADITQTPFPDDSVLLTITYTDDSDPVEVTIPAPKEGRGIVAITQLEDEYNYTLHLNYSDGTEEDINFSRPAIWSVVSEKPKSNEGKEGDYAFDTDHDIIYVKTENGWDEAVRFKTEATVYSVMFDKNADDAVLAVGLSTPYTVNRGETFYSSSYQVPLYVRSGYTFVGWSTSKTPNPTNGYFNDLTPVMSDMVLYAIWQEN